MKLGALAKQAQAAPLRDVYGYFDLFGQMREASDPGTAHGGEAGMGSTGVGLEWADVGGQAENQNAAPVTFTAPNETLANAVTWGQQYSGDGSRGAFNVDPTKLPQTQFGSVLNTGAVDANTRLYNPNMVYDDPNYGRITDARNIDTRSISDLFGPIMVGLAASGIGSLASAGIGAAGAAGSAIPGYAVNGVQLGRGVLSGNGIDWNRLLSMIAPQLGIPSWGTTLGRLAIGALGRKG